ncbi:L-histidine N(alpha)-methyltransferase [Gemmatimonas aurantiaca]|nr:L-histidine N(alpha)-methyltransferase [Gemmatimonas aurantiaca]
MPSGYKILDPKDFADTFDARSAFALDVLVGLSDTRKAIPSKYLYDDHGSELFVKIMEIPEYYVTNSEREALILHTPEISSMLDKEPFNLVELGAGSGEKTLILLNQFLTDKHEFQYVPIDISESAMSGLIADLDDKLPEVKTHGLVSDYTNGLKWLNHRNTTRNVVLFLGSNIGNFTHAQERFFLRNVWNSLNDNDLLIIGFDLKKDIELLLSAYNDAKGVTANFNLNLLTRINNELGGEFDLSKFRHYGTYDVFNGAMESYLVSLEKQEVFIEMIGRSFSFRQWEPIHTEYSYKFLPANIETLAVETGFVVEKMLYDDKKYFVDSVWRVNKTATSA